MNSEDAKSEWAILRRYLLGLACFVIGLAAAAALLAPVALRVLFPPPSIQEAKALANDVASFLSESAVSEFLTSCERDIRTGTGNETNCVPRWLRETNSPFGKFRCISKMDGTNLLVTAAYFDGANFSFIEFCNDPTVHRAGRVGEFSYAVRIWTNCSVTVDFMPK